MNTSKLYVGNLPFSVADQELKELFEAIGPVTEAKVITDRDTGRSKGFAFVTMDTKENAQKASDALNETEMGGRVIVVNEAKEKEKKTYTNGPKREYRR